MANEVVISIALTVTKLGVTNTLQRAVSRDMVGSNQIGTVQTIGESVEEIVTGDLDETAHIAFYHIPGEEPSERTVKISLDSQGEDVVAVLREGDVMYLPGAPTLYAVSSADDADLAVVACEN